jgi:hypothetical protein
MRLEPARYIGEDLALDAGSIYEVTFTDIANVSKLQRNGTDLTEVDTISGNDEYTFDESTKELRVQLASAPDVDTNVIVVFHYLFFATDEGRRLPQDPTSAESDSNPLRFWEPRLSGEPTATESFKNALAGVITISNTRASIIDDDFVIRSIIGGDNDSLSNKAAVIWMGVNSTITQLFSGACGSGFDISGSNIISLAIYDLMNKLTQVASLGDDPDDIYARRGTGYFTKLDPSKHDTPIPFVFGSKSPSKISRAISSGAVASVDPLYEFPLLNAKNISYNDDASVTNNRNWKLNRQVGFPLTQSFGTLQAYGGDSIVYNPTTTHLFFRFASYSNVNVGDTLTVVFDNGGGSQTGYFEVVYVGSFTASATSYNIMVQRGFGDTIPANLAAISSITANYSFCVRLPSRFVKYGSTKSWCAYVRDYTLNFFNTTAGYKTGELTFASDFESTLSIDNLGASETVAYRTTSAGHTHAEAMDLLITSAGLTPNAASITQADVDLSANVNFTVPSYDESQYRSYLGYCEDLTKSTLSYIAPNADGEIEYNLLSAPAATPDSTTDDTYLDGSLRSNVNYKDIKTALLAYNPNIQDEVSIDGGDAAAITESKKAKYLHDLEEPEKFRHVLDDISGRIDDIMAVKAERRLTYQFSTATKNIDSNLGDDVTLETSALAGSASSVNGKINKIARSSKNTTVTIDDLKDLS